MREIYIVQKRVLRHFIINFDYDENIAKRIKKIPSKKWYPKKKVWATPVSAESCVHVYDLINNYGFKSDDYIKNLVKGVVSKRDELLISSSLENADLDVDLNLELLPFQKAGVKYMLRAKRCFNADEMGLGKTVQAIAAIEKEQLFPAIIVCPATLKPNWKIEINKWTKNRRVEVLDSTSMLHKGADYYVINYDIIEKFLPEFKFMSFKSLTLDECQAVKTPKAKRTQAMRLLARNIEYIFMLSGTAIENRPKELIAQLQIMRRLEDFGGYMSFIRRYCDAEKTAFGMDTKGAKNLDELNQRLRSICYVRRLKSDVQKEIPPKESKVITVDLEDYSDYEMAEHDTDKWILQEKIKKTQGTFFQDDPEMTQSIEQGLIAQYAIELQRINAMRVQASRSKVEKVVEVVNKVLEKQKKVVVFANFIATQQALIDEYKYRCVYITGGMNPNDRQKAVTRFQNDPKIEVIICSLKGASTGITLIASRVVVFAELGWTPAVHDQAEDRIHRIGQKEKCWMIYVLAKNTIDFDMYNLIEEKRQIVNSALQGSSKNISSKSIADELISIIKKRSGNAKSIR